MTVLKIHIGNIIKEAVKQSSMTDVDFSKAIGKSRQNVYDLYKRDNVDVKQVLTISEVLGRDIIGEIVEAENLSFERKPTARQEGKIYPSAITPQKAKVLVEVELDTEDMIKLDLKNRIIQILNK